MEAGSGCSPCDRAFETEVGVEDVGEDGIKEGEDVGGGDVVEEGAWRRSCPQCLPEQCYEEGGQCGVREAELPCIPPLRTTLLPLADHQLLPLVESPGQSCGCSLPS